ncbi:hypothetical protein DER29_0463 [Micromonospora sp. M71_S20]|nr:hypothetical protein DER29_0463 [Micromonospora sp. M71_S20]
MISCRCGASWSGLTIAHCACCHRTFSAVSTFDRHRRNGRCVDPVTVGLAANAHGVFRTPGVSVPAPAR